MNFGLSKRFSAESVLGASAEQSGYGQGCIKSLALTSADRNIEAAFFNL